MRRQEGEEARESPERVDETLRGLRSSGPRRIAAKLAELSAPLRRRVKARVLSALQKALAGRLSTRGAGWMLAAAGLLAPREAGALATQALEDSAREDDPAGNRGTLLRLVSAIRPLEAIPALADIICLAGNPTHRELAAICIDKILDAHGPKAADLLRSHAPRLYRSLAQLCGGRAEPQTPGRAAGSRGWRAAAGRVADALACLLRPPGPGH